MTASKSNKKKSNTNTSASGASSGGKTIEVLYQKMGDRWFAFSMIEGELFVGSINSKDVQNDLDVADVMPEESIRAFRGRMPVKS